MSEEKAIKEAIKFCSEKEKLADEEINISETENRRTYFSGKANAFNDVKLFLESLNIRNRLDESPLISREEIKDEHKEVFDEMTKEEIWRKWQSDKKQLIKYLKVLTHYGVTCDADIEVVSQLYDVNKMPLREESQEGLHPIQKMYSYLKDEIAGLSKMEMMRDNTRLKGYEDALWDFKIIAKDNFGIELSEIKFSELLTRKPQQ